MPVALDLNTLSQPLRAVFQRVFGERDEACQQRDEARLEHRRVEVENKLLKERIRLLLLSKYGPKAEQLSDARLSLLELEPGVTREEVILLRNGDAVIRRDSDLDGWFDLRYVERRGLATRLEQILEESPRR